MVFPRAVREYVELGRFASDRCGRRIVASTARPRRAGVTDLIERRTDELSGGEWQRVRIARALAQEAPRSCSTSPPRSSTSPMRCRSSSSSLRSRASGTAVLLVSHQLNLVARFADSMIATERGSCGRVRIATGDVMDAPLLERVYGWPLVVSRDPASNAPALVPLRRAE